MALHVQAVLQAQRQEFFLRQLAAEAALYLVAVLGDALAHDEMVVLIVLVHVGPKFATGREGFPKVSLW
ncbi:hypothetical protein GCM10011572_45630 [Pseudoduganella buxea]|uniref:Uncharacterized protein n=1 Tax=Pseudoduganella buxea TaxID=1949069 RepID=A0ABQ1L5X2_9BURK|nr:hypothetical protein GCM10011572_45630 [Pseudoduganella buxea]